MKQGKKPVLLVMAAGMGSRYGGLKQIDPVDEQGDKIIDFSVYDAKRAGFEKVIFIIKKELEEVFREEVGNRMEGQIEVAYAFQELTSLPNGVKVPEGRTKPWGTGQAVLSSLPAVDGPFAVINADDYYGPEAFSLIYDFLMKQGEGEPYSLAMVGYQLKNTVTENGSVSRGVCKTDENGHLVSICEYTKIEKREDGIVYMEENGTTEHPIDGDTTVSMNLWGFPEAAMQEFQAGFERFLAEEMPKNPLKSEYYLPSVVSSLLSQKRAVVDVLTTKEAWIGVTYQEDRAGVKTAIAEKKAAGLYPIDLWK